MNFLSLKTATAIAILAAAFTKSTASDSIKSSELEEYIITSDIKRDDNLRTQAVSGTSVSATEMERKKTTATKELSATVPNLHIPDYGSKTTSSIYIRGLGSRIDNPVVGLYVDGIPYLNKSSFDFNLFEIKKIEVLRGPQGTLYGRNTMAGIINVQTKNASKNSCNTNAYLSYGNYNNINAKASHYNHIGNVGISVAGYYNKADGYFTNTYNNKKIDNENAAGARLSLNWNNDNFYIKFSSSFDHTKQDGYPYSLYKDNGWNEISYNDPCNYTRSLLTNGLFLKYSTDKIAISSATGWQLLDDDMNLDQDFSPLSMFTLKQAQKENSLSEEIVIKENNSKKTYQWLFGLFSFYKNLKMNAPVNFKEDGIEQLIENNVNNVEFLQQNKMELDITNNDLFIGTNLEYPTSGCAIYHQSTLKDIFINGLSVSGGLRLDYEKTKIKYSSNADVHYKFTMLGNEEQFVNTEINGSDNTEFIELLPKISVKYDINKSKNIYASVSKGYKAGGFNTQMFADILQNKMKNNIKEDLYNHIPNTPFMSQIKEKIKPILLNGEEIVVKDVIEYEPEESWNYEIGTHLSFFNNKLHTDATIFYIDCKNQQITMFSESGLGRRMGNAGRTESYGAEVAIKALPTDNLSLNASYGYTHATFKEYDNKKDNFAGNFVPYAPQNTVYLGAEYIWDINRVIIDRMIFNVNYNGAGKIYWTDSNSVYQGFYNNIGGSIHAEKKNLCVGIWAKNITGEKYNTFYFESLGNGFVQQCKPFRMGADLKISF